MKKHVKKYLIPHKENDHAPHLLHKVGAVGLLLVIGVVTVSVLNASLFLRFTDYLAAIFPSVLVDLTNEDRVQNDIPELRVSPVLEQAAQLKANDMAEKGYFAHVAPDGTTPWHWFREAGYVFTHAGENLAVNFVDSDDVERAWMESPGHRANIVNGNYTEIGIAMAEGVYQGRQTVFVVQLFGRPAPQPVAAAPAPAVAQAATEQPAPEPEVVTETPTFIAVESAGLAQADTGEESVETAEARGLAPQASFFERFLTQPHLWLQWFYAGLAALLILVLTATIFVEIEKQHPIHILYGVGLLVLLLVLVYFSRGVFFPEVLVPLI